jgi:hypothetical protein
MKQNPERSQLSEGALTALVLVLWFVTMAVGVIGMIVARQLIQDVAYALDVNPWALGALDKFGFLTLGISWLIMIYLVENWLSKAASAGLRPLVRRFLIIVGTLAAFIAAAVLIMYLIA